MGSLVRFMVRSRTHAIATAVIGMLLPPFSFISGGIVGLSVLRYSIGEGALVLAVTTAVSTLAMSVMLDTYQPVVIFVLFTGLPVHVRFKPAPIVPIHTASLPSAANAVTSASSSHGPP